MSTYQHKLLESNKKRIAEASAKVKRIEEQLSAAKKEVADLELRGKEIESGIIQGVMQKYDVPLANIEELLHSTFRAKPTKEEPSND
ncbi:MAG: hypothetical protein FWE21_01920 [Defluviitaleaceae bacterium]|nr:hypothetical protein [Defluviitaleaceae bacterium]